MYIELSSVPDLKLSRAILIYSSSKSEAVATDHDVVEGLIQAGRPLDLEAFRARLGEVTAATTVRPAKQPGAFTPIHPGLYAESPSWRVWSTPANYRSLFIKGKRKRCWLPPLVWCGHKHKRMLFIWASGPGALTSKTQLYRGRLSHHVHQDGNVCLGSMNPGNFQPSSWEAAFYETSFADLIPGKPYEISTLPKIGTLQSRLAMVARLEDRG